jgi:hypothetical protein
MSRRQQSGKGMKKGLTIVDNLNKLLPQEEFPQKDVVLISSLWAIELYYCSSQINSV